jgi:hypothetical protein
MSCGCSGTAGLIYVGQQVLVQVDRYTNNATGAYNNSASMTFSVQDVTNTEVADGSGSLTYVSASNGKYQGAILKTAAVEANKKYTVVITDIGDPGIVARLDFYPQ